MRNRRTSAAQAEQGRPNATAPHGYMPQYDDKTGKLINWVENPEESAVPKELFKRLRAGQSMRSIARDLVAQGLVNRSGRPFTDEHLRTMALRPAYGGYRKHTPKSRGRSFTAQNTETNLYRAIWAPLVEEETFWAVRRIMLDPARRSTRNGKAKHVLTMTMKCDVCGGTMGAAGDGASAYYFCRARRCVQINKAAVDALIIGDATRPGVILAYLASDLDDVEPVTDESQDDETLSAKLAAVNKRSASPRWAT
jgi:hypothetical protein